MALGNMFSTFFIFSVLEMLALSKPITEQSNFSMHGLLLRVKTLEQNFVDLRTQDSLKISGIEKKNRDLNSQLQDLVKFMNNSVVDPGPSDVFFTANINKDVTGLVKGQKVIYDNDFSNTGGGYDRNTGIFTAPTAGVYLFLANCNSLTAQTINIEITRDGSFKGDCYVEPAYDGEDEIGVAMVVERLNIGDKVWMEVYYADKGTADLGRSLNTFLGVLIHR